VNDFVLEHIHIVDLIYLVACVAGGSSHASAFANFLAGFAREDGGSAARSPAHESRQLRRLFISWLWMIEEDFSQIAFLDARR